jgi:hypothetical protein
MRIRFTTACYPACGDDRKYDDLHHGLLAGPVVGERVAIEGVERADMRRALERAMAFAA